MKLHMDDLDMTSAYLVIAALIARTHELHSIVLQSQREAPDWDRAGVKSAIARLRQITASLLDQIDQEPLI